MKDNNGSGVIIFQSEENILERALFSDKENFRHSVLHLIRHYQNSTTRININSYTFQEIRILRELETLQDLYHVWKDTDTKVDIIKVLSILPKLTSLELGYDKRQGELFRNVVNFDQYLQLTRLALRNIQIQGDEFAKLYEQIPNVKELFLIKCKFGISRTDTEAIVEFDKYHLDKLVIEDSRLYFSKKDVKKQKKRAINRFIIDLLCTDPFQGKLCPLPNAENDGELTVDDVNFVYDLKNTTNLDSTNSLRINIYFTGHFSTSNSTFVESINFHPCGSHPNSDASADESEDNKQVGFPPLPSLYTEEEEEEEKQLLAEETGNITIVEVEVDEKEEKEQSAEVSEQVTIVNPNVDIQESEGEETEAQDSVAQKNESHSENVEEELRRIIEDIDCDDTYIQESTEENTIDQDIIPAEVDSDSEDGKVQQRETIIESSEDENQQRKAVSDDEFQSPDNFDSDGIIDGEIEAENAQKENSGAEDDTDEDEEQQRKVVSDDEFQSPDTFEDNIDSDGIIDGDSEAENAQKENNDTGKDVVLIHAARKTKIPIIKTESDEEYSADEEDNDSSSSDSEFDDDMGTVRISLRRANNSPKRHKSAREKSTTPVYNIKKRSRALFSSSGEEEIESQSTEEDEEEETGSQPTEEVEEERIVVKDEGYYKKRYLMTKFLENCRKYKTVVRIIERNKRSKRFSSPSL